MDNKLLISGIIKADNVMENGYIIADRQTGLIEECKLGQRYRGHFAGEVHDYDENSIICMGDFNGHSHPEQSMYTDIVDKTWDLPTWCRNTIYKYSTRLKREHIYYACCRAFSRMIMQGVTSVMVSFYCHNNMDNELDKEVVRAAKEMGIRLYFGRMNYDIINPDAYETKLMSQKCYYETVQDAEKNFIQLMEDTDIPNVVVAPAIHSIHASTREAIVNAINLGNRHNRYVQFHLSEDRADVDLSLKLYGLRPVQFLSSLIENGEVDSLKNLMLSDCVWIDDEERELINKYEMRVVLNPRMNDRIKTGEADIKAFLRMGILPYLGTDGEASNDDLSITGEREFISKRYNNIPNNTIENIGRQPLKFKNGYINGITAGSYCDIKILKRDRVSDVYIGGRKTLSDGKLVGMDYYNDIEKPLKELAGELFNL